MASYIANDSDLTLVADAIRSKGKTSDSLVFPNEFVNAIAAISTDGTYNLQSKTIIPSTSTQTILPDSNYDALSSVTVESIPSAYIIPTGTKSITTNGTGINVAQYAAVNVNVATQDNTLVVTVDYNNQTEMWEPNKTYAEIVAAYNANKAIVFNSTDNAVIVDGAYNETDTVFYHVFNGLNNPIISEDYSYTAQGLTVEYRDEVVIKHFDSPSVTYTPTESQQTNTITYDPLYYSGIEQVSVTVNAIPSQYVVPTGTKSITINGTGIDVAQYATVDVAVSSGTPSLQSKTVTPTESQQTVTPDSGYDGLSQVTIGAISSSYVGSGIIRNPQLTSETTSDHGIIIEAASGYYSESQSVEIPAIQYDPPTGRYSGRDGIIYFTFPVTTPGYWDGDISFDINPSNITGINVRTETLTITPTESSQQIATYGDFIDGTITVDAIPSTYIGSGVTTKTAATITPGTTNQTIASGTYLTGTQTIIGDADLTAANIKTGVQIFGVTGSYTSDATASAADIINGKTGYVNGSKITGSLIVQKYYTGTSTPSSSLGSNGDIYVQQ